MPKVTRKRTIKPSASNFTYSRKNALKKRTILNQGRSFVNMLSALNEIEPGPRPTATRRRTVPTVVQPRETYTRTSKKKFINEMKSRQNAAKQLKETREQFKKNLNDLTALFEKL